MNQSTNSTNQINQASANPSQARQSPAKQTSRLKKIIVPLAIILLAIVVLILLGQLASKPQKTPQVNKAPLVEVLEVTRANVQFQIESQGNISPRTETTLVSEVSGVVKEVSDKFVVGGFFKKGELLLKIDPLSYEVALLQAQARLDGANAKLVEEEARGQQAEKEWSLTGRLKNNAPILALRQPQLQQAKADVKAAEADVRSAQIKLQRTQILAPYDAMLKAKIVDIGQYVSTGSQLATTFAVDYAEIRLPIKEADFGYIQIPALGSSNQTGSRVELSLLQAGVVKSWKTFIVRSEGVIDINSRVNYVVAKIDDPYGLLANDADAAAIKKPEIIKVGTFVKAKIAGIIIPDVITVPRKAVIGADTLYLLDDNRKLQFATVNILRSDPENIYITDGMTAGDKVVLTKLATAVDGMTLRLEGDATNETADEKKAASNDTAVVAEQGGSR